MTSSFQPQARPVDTFVAPSTVAPTTELDQLTRALQTVNPGINKFIDIKFDEAIKKEQIKGRNIAIQQELDSGNVNKLVSKVRKTDGNNAAKQLIGGSIFADKAFGRTKAKLAGSKLDSILKNSYQTTVIEVEDKNGNVIQKTLNQFSPDSSEFINWYNNIISNSLTDISNDVDEEILDTFFYPKMQESIFNITKHHQTSYAEYKLEKIKSIGNEYLTDSIKYYLEDDIPKAQEQLNFYSEEIKKIGLTGINATEIYSAMVNNIELIGEDILFNTEDKDLLFEIKGALRSTAENIPYGQKELQKDGTYKQKNLTNHPKWLEMWPELSEKIEDETYEDFTQGPAIEKAKNKSALKNKLLEISKLPIATEEQRAERKRQINKLKQNPKFREFNEIFSSNNYPFIQDIGEELLLIKNKIRKGDYQDSDGIIEDLSILEDRMIELGITDTNLTDKIGQTFNLAEDFKSIYERARDYSKDLRESIDEYYRSQSTSSMNIGGISIMSNGLDSNTFKDKQELLIDLENRFEKWIDDNYYKKNEETGKEIGGPSATDLREHFEYEEDRIRKRIFKLDVPFTPNKEDTIPPDPNTVPDGSFGIDSKSTDDFTDRYQQQNLQNDSTPGFGNTDLEVSQNPNEDILTQLTNLIGQLTPGGSSPVAAGDLKGKPLPDYGGLAKLVRGGESAGSGLYNAYNGGTTDSAAQMDITSKTIAEMEQMQQDNKVFAVGAYQFTPGVLTEARKYAGLDADSIMTPAVQDRLFWGMILSGRKRPALTDYLEGKSDDLRAAQKDLAYEFAAIQGPDGVGMYDNDSAGNYATIKSDLVKQVLINARKAISNK